MQDSPITEKGICFIATLQNLLSLLSREDTVFDGSYITQLKASTALSPSVGSASRLPSRLGQSKRPLTLRERRSSGRRGRKTRFLHLDRSSSNQVYKFGQQVRAVSSGLTYPPMILRHSSATYLHTIPDSTLSKAVVPPNSLAPSTSLRLSSS